MEKVIYDNQSSKLVAKISGDILELNQTLEGEVIGQISMYLDEARELNSFVNEKEQNKLNEIEKLANDYRNGKIGEISDSFLVDALLDILKS